MTFFRPERRSHAVMASFAVCALVIFSCIFFSAGVMFTSVPKTTTIYRIVTELDVANSLVPQSELPHQSQKRTAPRKAGAAGIGGDAAWHRSCSPTPWLLPANTSLPYTGLHNDLGDLARVQARDIDGYRAVSVVFFNYHQAVMMQNAVYSMVKWSGVCNYIVAVWDAPSLEVCTAMNLPCFNATALTPGNATIGADHEARLHSEDYVKITWMKPILVSKLLDLGFVVHATDADVSFAPADLTRSYLTFITEANATVAFQRENRRPFVVNTGNYMILPNAEGKAFMAAWLSTADAAITSGDHEQTALGELYHRSPSKKKPFLLCATPPECREAARQAAASPDPLPIVRRTSNAWFAAYGNPCITKNPWKMFAVHPCTFPHLYFHAVCVIGSSAKIRALKGAGFWFLDDGDNSDRCPVDADNPNVVRCHPLVERVPQMEDDFLQCDTSRLAFNYYQTVNPGAAAVDPKKYVSPPPSPKRSPSPSLSPSPTPQLALGRKGAAEKQLVPQDEASQQQQAAAAAAESGSSKKT